MTYAVDTASPSSLAEARGNIYGFLSRILLEPPSEGLLAPLHQPGFLASLASVFGEDALSYLREFIQNFPEKLEPLIQEYHDLFIVPLGKYVAPYEAVYRDEIEVEGKRVKGLLMGQATISVQQSYREANISVSDSFLDLPDHAGMELSFMCYLCNKQAEALKKGESQRSLEFLQMQKTFLQEHLRPWIPSLCDRISRNAEGPLYKGVASLIEVFTALEAETLSQARTEQ